MRPVDGRPWSPGPPGPASDVVATIEAIRNGIREDGFRVMRRIPTYTDALTHAYVTVFDFEDDVKVDVDAIMAIVDEIQRRVEDNLDVVEGTNTNILLTVDFSAGDEEPLKYKRTERKGTRQHDDETREIERQWVLVLKRGEELMVAWRRDERVFPTKLEEYFDGLRNVIENLVGTDKVEGHGRLIERIRFHILRARDPRYNPTYAEM